MNKKYLIFGLPMLAILLVTAATLYYNVSRDVVVNPSFTFSGDADNDAVAGGENVFTDRLSAVSQTSVNVPLSIETTPVETGITHTINYLLDSEAIVWDSEDWYTALSLQDFENGMGTVTILVDEGTTLSSLGDIIFDENALSGYPVSVNILLDINDDGIFDSRKNLVTGDLDGGVDDVLKIESAWNGGTPGSWTPINLIDGTTNAWLYSAQPGAGGIVLNTITQWIAGESNDGLCYETTTEWVSESCDVSVSGLTPVYGIQIESLGWIEASNSQVSNIEINGQNVSNEPTLLPNGELNFNVETEFGVGVNGTYTLTTKVTTR